MTFPGWTCEDLRRFGVLLQKGHLRLRIDAGVSLVSWHLFPYVFYRGPRTDVLGDSLWGRLRFLSGQGSRPEGGF